jgi:UDP-N-acetylglucosamine 1-carboxyvinyltransferase
VDTHFIALSELGAKIEVDGRYTFTTNKLAGADIFLDEASVTATENAVMAAALAEGRGRHPQLRLRTPRPGPLSHDQRHGRVHRGHRLNILTVEGVKKLHGAEFALGLTTWRSDRSSA